MKSGEGDEKMSMTMHVIGFRPPEAKWKRMKKVYDACRDAKVNLPDEVRKFFEGEEPDDRGVEVNIDCAVTKHERGGENGFEVDVSKLPSDVTRIRFYNNY